MATGREKNLKKTTGGKERGSERQGTDQGEKRSSGQKTALTHGQSPRPLTEDSLFPLKVGMTERRRGQKVIRPGTGGRSERDGKSRGYGRRRNLAGRRESGRQGVGKKRRSTQGVTSEWGREEKTKWAPPSRAIPSSADGKKARASSRYKESP